MENTYTEPVSKLLKLGRPHGEWLDYLSLGIASEHIPELIRLLEDHELRDLKPPEDFPDDEDPPEWYAQIHAWRALGQLKAEEAIPALVGLFHLMDDGEDDWFDGDANDVFALIGPVSIHPLKDCLLNEQNGLYARTEAASALREMSKKYPETRDLCVGIIASVVEKYEENDESLNGFLISDLVDMKAVEHIDLIEKAFASKNVDEFIRGDFEDIQIDLGLREKRSKPISRPSLFQDVKEDTFVPDQKSAEQKKREKDKRKQEKKSRKKNRKKK
jgi:hypothetical protein